MRSLALVGERTQSKGRPVGGLLRVVPIIRLLAGEGMVGKRKLHSTGFRSKAYPHPPPAFAGAGSPGTFSRVREKGELAALL